MKVYPDRYKAYTLEGKNVFPVYGMSGNITSSYVAILIKGDPPLDGADFGIKDEVVIFGDGAWIVVKFNHSDDESTIAHKVSKAEKLLDPIH